MRHDTVEQPRCGARRGGPSLLESTYSHGNDRALAGFSDESLTGARNVWSPTALSLRPLPRWKPDQSRRGGPKWLG
jgi:hypothetical protein